MSIQTVVCYANKGAAHAEYYQNRYVSCTPCDILRSVIFPAAGSGFYLTMSTCGFHVTVECDRKSHVCRDIEYVPGGRA